MRWARLGLALLGVATVTLSAGCPAAGIWGREPLLLSGAPALAGAPVVNVPGEVTITCAIPGDDGDLPKKGERWPLFDTNGNRVGFVARARCSSV